MRLTPNHTVLTVIMQYRTVCFIAAGLAMVEMKNQQIQTETIQPMEQTGNMTQQEVVYTNESIIS